MPHSLRNWRTKFLMISVRYRDADGDVLGISQKHNFAPIDFVIYVVNIDIFRLKTLQ